MATEKIDATVVRTISENGKLTIIARRHGRVTDSLRESLLAIVLGGAAAQRWNGVLKSGDPVEADAQKSIVMFEFEDFVMPKFIAPDIICWTASLRDYSPENAAPQSALQPEPYQPEEQPPRQRVSAQLRERGLLQPNPS